MKHEFPILQDRIKEYLPHREPMLFVDRVLELSDDRIVIESDISLEAYYFKGHFPGMPIMPGVIIIETVAQAGALLVSLTRGLEDDKFIAFSNVESAKFKRPVYPNEILRVEVCIEKIRLPFYKFSGKAYVGDSLATTLSFAAAQMDFSKNQDKLSKA